MIFKDYTIKEIDLSSEGLEEICLLLKSSSKNRINKTHEYLNWSYVLNPNGKAFGYNAYYENRLIAHYVNQPMVSVYRGIEIKSLLSYNIATHPEHRKKGLFIKLAELTYELARNKEFDIVLGVANENSLHGLIKYLGHKIVAPLKIKAGLGIYSKDLTKNMQYNRIWDYKTLKWRLSNPIRNYEIIHAKGQYIITALMGKLKIRTLVGSFPDKNIIPDLELKVINSPVKPVLYVGLDDSINWNSNTYFDLPKFLRPSPMVLHYKCLTGEKFDLNLHNTEFKAIDFDAF